jgi:predicted ATP-grasp superfamily ATP-dependent carboligase
VAGRVVEAVRRLAAAFDLRGLGSLDFLLDGDRVHLLEVNPRPPASMALYAARPLLAAHLRACRDGVLPDWPSSPPAPAGGTEIVFSRHAFVLDNLVARQLSDAPQVHDLPCAGTRFAAGDPVCSLDVSGSEASQRGDTDGDAVQARLNRGREALLKTLETCS